MRTVLWMVVAIMLVSSSEPLAAQRADTETWEYVVSASLLTAGAFADHAVYRALGADSVFDRAGVGRAADMLGKNTTYLPVLAVAWVAGRLAGSDGVADAAWHSAVALGTATAVAKGLKFAMGRARPGVVGADPDEFRFFQNTREYESFPSGHALTAFTMAAALAAEAEDDRVAVISYAVASGVGISRIITGNHWTSDVVGGGILGILLTQGVLRTLHTGKSHGSSVPPMRVPAYIVFRIPTV